MPNTSWKSFGETQFIPVFLSVLVLSVVTDEKRFLRALQAGRCTLNSCLLLTGRKPKRNFHTGFPVFQNLFVFASVCDGQLYHFRTQGGREKEVDFLLEMDGKVIAIEAKYSAKVGFRDVENILFLKDVLPNWTAGLVVYNGSDVLTLGRNIYAVPWAMI
ncbi:MAG: DUF4143 domain-containing protein [Proteobacteria bacterium]|nr:DUF4143 domain-containing protein [Pseudomonadota bacterium]NIS71446.1 DUF4143 domain-containing protein [Pseudomonadota bacterium]